MVFDDPQSRNEAILQNLLGADNVLVDPESRIEAILQSILNETAYQEEPQSRMEELLLAVKNDETGWDAEALSRNEAIIIAWLNDEEYTEEPQSRIEELLIAWLASIPKYVLKTVVGKVLSITDAIEAPAEALSVEMLPIQDLHGYESPWAGGGGKNLDPYDNLNHSSRLWGTSNGNQKAVFQSLPTGTYTMSCKFKVLTNPDSEENVQYGVLARYSDGGGGYVVIIPYQLTTAPATVGAVYEWHKSFTLTESLAEQSTLNVYFYCASGGQSTVTANAYDIQIEKGDIANPTFAPYSNLCPITGTESAEVVRTGKNLLNLVESEMVVKGWNRVFPISLKAGTYIISCQNKFGASTKGANVSLTDEGDANIIKALNSGYTFGDTVFVGTATTITAEDAAKIKNIRIACRANDATYQSIVSGNIQLELGSTVTTFVPYDPQSTTLQVNWGAVGKNLFDIAERVLNQTKANGTAMDGYTLNNGVLSISKDVVNYGRVMLSAMPMKAGTYTLSFAWTASGSGRISYSIRNMGADPKVDIVGSTGTTTASVSQTFTLDTDANVAISIQPEGSATGTMSITNIMLNTGSSALPYEPYTRTIFGGTVDAVRGEMVTGMAEVDLGDFTWNKDTNRAGVFYSASVCTTAKNRGQIVADIYKWRNDGVPSGATIQNYNNLISLYPSYNVSYVYIIDHRFDAMTSAEVKTALAGVKAVYELSTPITLTIDPQTLTALRNNNTIWSDANGDITLTYRAKAGD